MITLMTGLPGSCKTLYMLAWVEAKRKAEEREVYYSGINDLKLPWIECDPAKWFELPKNSIVVIDECQRVFRPRANGSQVPEYESRLETHRHQGIDLVLITQHPSLVSLNVRRLVGQHFHAVRKFGMHWSTIHEWASTKDNCDKVRKDSIKHEFKFPKEVFGWYKSAEVHTHKRRIPAKVWALIGIIVLAPLLFFGAFRLANDVHKGVGAAGATPDQAAAAAPRAAGPATPAEYVKSYAPRVPGLAYTAPAYDKVTEPTQAPYPAACISSATRCGCYSQQGTRLEVPDNLCRQIAAGGFFVAWKTDGTRQDAQPARSEPVPGPAAGPDALVVDAGGLLAKPQTQSVLGRR